MGSLADLTLGDIARALGRYKPVVLTIAGILVLVAVAPGPRRVVGDALAGVPGPVRAIPAAPDEGTTTTTDPGADVATDEPGTFAADDSSSFSSGSPSFGPSTSPTTSSGFTSDDEDSGSSSSDDFAGSDSGSSFGGGGGGGGFSDPTAGAPAPLTIVAVATARNGTTAALSTPAPPAGTLPVGKRFGQDERYSYVRLSGDDTTLVLSLDPAGNRATSGPASVSACRVTRDNWPEGENKPLNEIPFDRASCANGVRDDAAASYRFDLSAFGDRTDAKGFALVPGPDASVDFQVTFKRS